MHEPTPMLLTVRQTARMLAVSESMVRKLIVQAKLRAVRFGTSVRVHAADVASLVERGAA